LAGGLPLVARPSANFLGTDVSSIAAGVVGFYPWIAVAEAARVAGVATAILLGLGWYAAACERLVQARHRATRMLIFPVAPLAALACWGVGAAIQYPAIFEGGLPKVAVRALFTMAFTTSPTAWFAAAWGFALIPGLVRAWPRRGGGHVALALRLEGTLVVLLAAGIGVTSLKEPRAKGVGRQAPNVLLIGIDSLRVDRLAREDVTPSLAALANDARTVAFRDHWVGVPRTFPSWIEILTGRPAPRTGVRHMFPGYGARSEEFAGLGTVLASAGYQNAVFSDFAGDIFPRFAAGMGEVRAPKLDLRTMIRLSVDQLFPAFLPFMTTGVTRRFFPALAESPAFADPGHLTSDVIEWIERRGDRPWFATVFYSTAHFPYAAPYPHYKSFADRRYGGEFRFQKNPDLSGTAAAEADVAQVRALYDGAVQSVDEEVGRLLAAIRTQGLDERTIVVVTADHGEDLFEAGVGQGHGEHLRGENVLRVPFLLRLPTRPAVRSVDFTTRSIDVASTVAAATGISTTVGDGVDLLPWTAKGAPPRPRLAAYAETGIWFSRSGSGFFQSNRLDYPGIAGLLAFDQGFDGEIVLDGRYESMIVTAKHRMLLSEGRKVIYMPTPQGVRWELYDQRSDPANRVDLAASQPEEIKRLGEELLATIARLEAPSRRVLDGYVVPQ
jgi:arylsulfatase A-like enzyme